MLFLEEVAVHFSALTRVLLDTTLLAALSTPIIYYWVFKPYITERDKHLEQIRHLAYHDPLTNLANRRLLFQHLEKAIAFSARHQIFSALILIDIDNFKPINDKYGHDAGDALLIEIAKRLENITRTEDIVSRIGGDEFVVVVSQLSKSKEDARAKADAIAQKLRVAIYQPFEYGGKYILANSSLGVRVIGQDRHDPDSLLKDADNAMYSVKGRETGGVGVCDH